MAIAGAAIKAAKPIAKEAVEKVVKSLPDFLTKFNKVGKELNISPQTMNSTSRFLGDQTADNLPKQITALNTMLDGMQSTDPIIKNDSFRSFGEFDQNIRPLYETSDRADAIQKRVASYGSRAEGKALKESIGQDLLKHPTFEPRQDLWDITDAKGDAKRVSGTDRFLQKYQETGEIDPKQLAFKSKSKTKASKAKRAAIMRVPKEETTAEFHRRFPNDPVRADRMAKEYNSSRMSGYMVTAEAARQKGLTTREFLQELRTGETTKLTQAQKNQRTTYASGHIHAANAPDNPLKPRPSDSPLYNPATSGETTRIEEALENISGGNKIEHDINPYAAEKAGIPYNWKEDIDVFIDRYTDTSPHKLPMWQRDFTTDELDIIFNIPGNADKETVDKIFAAIADARRNPNHKRQNFAQELLEWKREIGSEGDPLTGKTDNPPVNVSDMVNQGLGTKPAPWTKL